MAETAAKSWSQFIAGEKNKSAKEQDKQIKSVSMALDELIFKATLK